MGSENSSLHHENLGIFFRILQVEWWSHLWLCCFPSSASPTPQRWATGAASLCAVWPLCSELCGSLPKTLQLTLSHMNLRFWPFPFPFFLIFLDFFFHSEGGLSPQPAWIINLSNYKWKRPSDSIVCSLIGNLLWICVLHSLLSSVLKECRLPDSWCVVCWQELLHEVPSGGTLPSEVKWALNLELTSTHISQWPCKSLWNFLGFVVVVIFIIKISKWNQIVFKILIL